MNQSAFEKMNETDGLPTLVLTKIFSFLTISEKLRAKQVCKLWKVLIEQIVQQRLCIHACRLPKPSHFRWHDGSNARVNDQDLIAIPNETTYDERVNRYLKSVDATLKVRLRKIYLYGLTACSMLLRQIEIFKRLDELALERIHHVQLNKLSSPSLQTICFNGVRRFLGSSGFPFPVQLETPNLTRFIFWNWSLVDDSLQEVSLSRPETIVYMKCKKLYFPKLSNLEHLICQEIDEGIDLRNYPKLRKLEYYPERSDQALSRIERLKEHRRSFSPDLEIFVSGFKLDAEFCESPVFFNLVNSIDFVFSVPEDQLTIFARNFPKLTNQFPWRLNVNYPLLLRSFGGQLPGNFFEIFPLIGWIKFGWHQEDWVPAN